MKNLNGSFECGLQDDVKQQITEVHSTMTTLLEHTQHLTKLDCLERIENKLLTAATGKDHVPMPIAKSVIKILGAVCIVLVVCIAFLLTGETFGVIGSLHR